MKHFIFCISFFILYTSVNAQSDFIVKPYLQIGSDPSPNAMNVVWHVSVKDTVWLVEYKTSSKWIKAERQSSNLISIVNHDPFIVFTASLKSLIPGNIFTYRVSKNGKIIFSSEGKASKSVEQSFRFVASGDMGAGTKEAKQIAQEIYKTNPDFVTIAGDIVYDYGLISEYTTKFWPIYNTDKVDSAGAPLMRSTPFVAAVGNHDADTRDLNKYPDALAYYLFWDQPLNGPLGIEGGAIVPFLKGSESHIRAFKDAAGERYPKMTNFSFNYGNAHWTVLDADTYVDWTDSTLLDWVKKDLDHSKDAIWHFVLFHHPGFNSSIEHFEQQQMRLLAPIFEKGNVDIVFNGHVHNYQRTFPMQFVPERNGTLLVGGKDSKTVRGRVVTGKWKLDHSFNGKDITKPQGVIYLVSGAGGQTLYNPEQQDDPDTWQKFTEKFISKVHSFTVVDINGKTLSIKQIDVNGKEVDALKITK